jgi:hypothetical protein
MRKSTREIKLSLWKCFSCIVLAGILLVGVNLSLIIAQNNFSKTRLTTSPIPGRSSAMPTLNADGTRIAFVRKADFLGR